MKDKINKICTELNDGKIAVVQATEKLLDLFSVSKKQIEESEQKGYDKGHFDTLMKMVK